MNRRQQITTRNGISRRPLTALLTALLLAGSVAGLSPALAAKKLIPDSPLSSQEQSAMKRAASSMRGGHYQRAQVLCQEVLDGATDVSKCIAIAAYTEPVGLQMVETRRACMNKALGLAQSREDLIMVTLKSRQYQFFEVTRQAVQNLIGNAKTIPDLYDLANKSQEVALNDVAHLAMVKAYTGLKNQQDAFEFCSQAKLLGMEDLLRKGVKEMIDSEDDPEQLCDLMVKIKGYGLRDMNRYGLRKCLDDAKTIDQMKTIFVVARELNEPDVANRANYFVRKGELIKKIKDDRAAYESQLRVWREGGDIEAARQQQDAAATPDTTTKKKPDGTGTGF